jgi:hypothetical protein
MAGARHTIDGAMVVNGKFGLLNRKPTLNLHLHDFIQSLV